MTAQGDVLIFGGGVIGLSTAYYLARTGARVTVLERGDFGREASWAGAGIIPPGNPDRARQPFARLRALSAACFPHFSQELRELTGIDNGYRRCGAVELHSGVDAATVTAWQEEGIEFEDLPVWILGDISAEFDHLPEPGYYLPGAAQVRNPWHLRALEQACRTLGVTLQSNTAVRELQVVGQRVRSARGDVQSWQGDRFLIAAGAWADDLLAPIGLRLGVFPIRGQIVLFRLPAPRFPAIVLQGARYLVPRADGRVLAGSTEENVGFDRSTTAEAFDELQDFALRTAPCLAAATIEKTWAGLRPATRDGLPFLGPVPGIDNLFVAAGHFRSGIQTSPATGQVMSEVLLGKPPSVPLDAFALQRASVEA